MIQMICQIKILIRHPWVLIVDLVHLLLGSLITRYANEKEKVQILYAEEFDRPDFNEMLSKIGDLVF